ncbi:hypothetical protein [uncultured Psychroserpens sp.]|uniref:hypothetical protein n=1 Tax=uncultured Psychroserpens sp. TaxID=255436 RepID=UPI00262D8103|nr:hypothetical protein [uncultured Psychroserpens sp.]
MKKKSIKTILILVVLFFLPVVFLLFLYPATHNYDPLEIVNEDVTDLQFFASDNEEDILLKEHITILGFLGNRPMEYATAALNLKELVYDKFKGFKRFQIVMILPKGAKEKAQALKKEISKYEDLRFWHFVYGEPNDIETLFESLKIEEQLSKELATDHVFIIDKELKQRGRLDDREDNEIEKEEPIYKLFSYDCIEVAEIKNKMSDDLRILFTEYRQKRKGKFDSSSRRAEDLNAEEN